jgi:hypothetical protein
MNTTEKRYIATASGHVYQHMRWSIMEFYILCVGIKPNETVPVVVALIREVVDGAAVVSTALVVFTSVNV